MPCLWSLSVIVWFSWQFPLPPSSLPLSLCFQFITELSSTSPTPWSTALNWRTSSLQPLMRSLKQWWTRYVFFPLQANLNQTVVLHCTSHCFTGLRDVIYVDPLVEASEHEAQALFFWSSSPSLPLQLESDYHRIPGSQTVNVVLIK